MASAKILLVEDNLMNMELFTDLLESGGFEVIQAKTAEEGIRIAKADRPDLILMDIGLPGMDGLAATRALKEDPDTKDIRVVALTAHAMLGDESRIKEAGCDGYLTKPINTRDFCRQIKSLLSMDIK